MRKRKGLLFLSAIAAVMLVGCGLSTDDSPPKPPPSTAGPQVEERPETLPPGTDPAAVARLERARRSLEQGLEVNHADADGRTPLMMAAFEGYTEVVELLLEHGANVDQRDNAGLTALIFASSGPFSQTVELLIDNGADVNHASTTEGWTALMMAASEGHRPVVELLLRRGADIGATDRDGDTAIDHARNMKKPHIVDLLESWPEGS